MNKRVRVGIFYSDNENWIGGTYYIQNLISALNHLKEEEKPELIILSKTKEEFNQIESTGYSKLSWKELKIHTSSLTFFKRALNKVSFILNGNNKFPQPLEMDLGGLDFLFPSLIGLNEDNSTAKNIYWIPDFQEQKLPQFFSGKEIQTRTQSHFFIAESNGSVVFSSRDASDEFCRLFPESNCKKFILNFAVTHPEFQNLNLAELKNKYKINSPYYFVPNQFWSHKNQLVVLKALKEIRDKGYQDFQIVFSGKEHDYRNPGYFESLKKFCNENLLNGQALFLGFIDRKEQLKLMSGAIAIIQPSLFEGWSTVVEDAKAINKFVIASDLSVHRDQLRKNAAFFDPADPKKLSEIILGGLMKDFIVEEVYYKKAIKDFGSAFLKIIMESKSGDNKK